MFSDRAVRLPLEKGEPNDVALADRQPFDCATHILSVGGLCHFLAGVGAVVLALLPECFNAAALRLLMADSIDCSAAGDRGRP